MGGDGVEDLWGLGGEEERGGLWKWRDVNKEYITSLEINHISSNKSRNMFPADSSNINKSLHLYTTTFPRHSAPATTVPPPSLNPGLKIVRKLNIHPSKMEKKLHS